MKRCATYTFHEYTLAQKISLEINELYATKIAFNCRVKAIAELDNIKRHKGGEKNIRMRVCNVGGLLIGWLSLQTARSAPIIPSSVKIVTMGTNSKHAFAKF
jgi:hypothetical protein